MNERIERALAALHRLHVMFARGLRTPAGHPEAKLRERDFRHALAEFILALALDPDTTTTLHHAAMNPNIPTGDALWDDKGK